MIRILQITDTHLFANDQGRLLKLNTRDSFNAVIQAIRKDAAAIDLIMLTGDMSQDGSRESYQYLAEQLKVFSCPIYWLPGNHDDYAVMQSVLSKTQLRSDKQIQLKNWDLLLLDSNVPKKALGHLAPTELQKIKQFISEAKQPHLIVLLHHQAIPMGSVWLDSVGLTNGPDFLAAIKQDARIRHVIFGHVHQAHDSVYDGIRFIASPSTSVQFLPKSTEFALDKQLPGYQYIMLYEDGMVKTEVKRLTNFHGEVDYSSKGY